MSASKLQFYREQALRGYSSDIERCRAWLAQLHLPESLLPPPVSPSFSPSDGGDASEDAHTPELSTGSTAHSGNSGSTLLEDAGQYQLDAEGWQVGIRHDQEDWQVAGVGKARRRKNVSAVSVIETAGTDEGSVTGSEASRVMRPVQQPQHTTASGAKEGSSKNARKRRKKAAKRAGKTQNGVSAQSHRAPHPHRDEQQLDLDINRSFVWMSKDPGRECRKAQLKRLIVDILRKHPILNYFQGYHDVLSVILLALSPGSPTRESSASDCDNYETVFAVAERVSLHLLRDSLGSTMAPNIGQLKVLRGILRIADPSYAEQIESASSVPYFALSWVLTWLSHDLDHENSKQVMDFVIAYGPAGIVYIAAAIVLVKKDTILGMDADELEDPAMVHHALQQLPTFTRTQSNRRPSTGRVPAPKVLRSVNARSVVPDPIHADSDVYTSDLRTSLSELSKARRLQDDSESDPGDVSDTPGQLRVALNDILRDALKLSERIPLASVAAPLGPKSALLTWEQTFASNEPASRRDWDALDAQAEKLLSSDIELIVRDGAETPPETDVNWEEQEEKGERHGGYGHTTTSARRKGSARTAVVGTAAMTLVGVVGVGVALYAAQRGEGDAMLGPAKAALALAADLSGRLAELTGA